MGKRARRTILLFVPTAAIRLVIIPRIYPTAFQRMRLRVTHFDRRQHGRRIITWRMLAIGMVADQVIQRLRRRNPRRQHAPHIHAHDFAVRVQRRTTFRLHRRTRRVAKLVVMNPQRAVEFTAIWATVTKRRAGHTPTFMGIHQDNVFGTTSVITPRTGA